MRKIRFQWTVVLAVALSGCGGAGRPDDVAKEFAAAVEDGNLSRACALVSEQKRRSAETAFGSCEKSLKRVFGSEVPTARIIDQNARRARVELAGDGKKVAVGLEKEDGEWRVTGAE